MGPLPTSKGYTHLLTAVDRFTRWPEAIPLTDTSTETVAHGFLLGWVACFGVPASITSDRGGKFESDVWHRLMKLLGTHHICTTAYHPCANGLVERLHRQLKAALMAHSPQSHWIDTLPLVLLGIHSALKEDIACTSAELVYGTTLRLPGEFFSTVSSIDVPDNICDEVNVCHAKTPGSATPTLQTTSGTGEPRPADSNTCLCLARCHTQGSATPV